MTEFYKNLGYNAYYMMNNVKSLDIDKEEKNLYKTKQENQSVNIGIYNAHSRELKNIYTQILATTFLKETNIDIVQI